jgi:hypothetical protein
MTELCLFCGKEAAKKLGNKFICDSCINDLHSALKEHIEKDIKENEDLRAGIIKINELFDTIASEIRDIKSKMR